jgi:hypothetical protein
MFEMLFSAVWQWFLGKFGMSDAQKLGRLEVQHDDDRAALKLTTAQLKAEEAKESLEDALRDHIF